MTEKMTDPPNIIYLQWHGEPYYNGTIDPDSTGREVTWCVDRIWDVDIKYLLATPEREAALAIYEALKMNLGWHKANLRDGPFNPAGPNAIRLIEVTEAALELATVK